MCIKITKPIVETFIAKKYLHDLFVGLNMLIILSEEYRQTREDTHQWVCKEKLHTKNTHMLETWSNLYI